MRTTGGRGRGRGIQKTGEPADPVSGPLPALGRPLACAEQVIGDARDVLPGRTVEKERYASAGVAEAMEVFVYVVAERWRNAGRVRCVKVPERGKWRIPGLEYQRVLKGGSPRPRKK